MAGTIVVTSERQQSILEMTERRGYVSIEALASHFDVTPQTIRRDINELCGTGLLVRQHGGASLPIMNSSYTQRHVENQDAKLRIAHAVAAYLPDRASVFMPLGTTVEACARAIAKAGKRISVVTNSIEVARIFWSASDLETVVAGGVLQQRNGGLVGQKTIEAIGDYRCDYLVSGIGAIESSGDLFDFYDAEIAVMQAMRRSARHHLLAADCTKFHRSAKQRFCGLSDVDKLFTDGPVPNDIASAAAAAGCEIVIAPAGVNSSQAA